MEKKMFDFKTKTIVATGLGAALFMLLFMYVKIPTGIPETEIQTAYGIGAFFAALFGPIAGGLIALIGHALSDGIQYGSIWWSWAIASGVSCFIVGTVYPRLHVEDGVFEKKDIINFVFRAIIANIVAWMVVAPCIDIFIYGEPANLAFIQGTVATVSDSLSMCVIGTLLLVLYSKTRSKKGSLTKED